MKKIREVAKIMDFKFHRDAGWKVVWVFNHSSCHSAMLDDALVVSRMNVNPGGRQPTMRDGWWDGKPQQMYLNLGKISKGMWRVPQERSQHAQDESGKDERDFR